MLAPKRLCAAGAMAACLLALAATPALAVRHPTGGYAPFLQCPLGNPKVTLCMVARITGGELVIGKKVMPIDRTIAIQAGLTPTGRALNEYNLAPAEDGNTLSKTPLKMPGGLTGLVGGPEVTATAELTNPAVATLNMAHFVFEEGVSLLLPLRIRIQSPTLGNDCHIGSEANPVILRLTDGPTNPLLPNMPIRGRAGSFDEPEPEMLAAEGNVVVDNAFFVPAVTGCGVHTSLSTLASAFVGVPSAAGRNTAILDMNMMLAEPNGVIASEQTG